MANILADWVKTFVGSWTYVIVFNLCFFGWMVIPQTFDVYPFILLNLILSYLAGVTGPLIMVSQNRQEAMQKDQEEVQKQILMTILHLSEASREMLKDHKAQLEIIMEHDKEISEELDIILDRTNRG